MTGDARDLALIGLIATAPLALTLIVALIMGYKIHVDFTKNGRRKRRTDDNGGDE